MAGVGPRPKDPDKRARRNAEPVALSIIEFKQGKQPRLPVLPQGKWNPRTTSWWAKWKEAPQAAHFMATDWEFLLETAMIHHHFWNGDMTLAPELRLRVAKFGATLEDRARIRMQYAQTEDAEAKARKTRSKEPKPYEGLRAIDPAATLSA